jgi:hypothetical protein
MHGETYKAGREAFDANFKTKLSVRPAMNLNTKPRLSDFQDGFIVSEVIRHTAYALQPCFLMGVPRQFELKCFYTFINSS